MLPKTTLGAGGESGQVFSFAARSAGIDRFGRVRRRAMEQTNKEKSCERKSATNAKEPIEREHIAPFHLVPPNSSDNG